VGGNAGVVVPDRGRVVRVGSTDVNGFDLRLAAAASWSWSRLGSAAKVGEGRLGAVVVKGDKERPRLLANWDDVRECCRTIGENAACCSSWAMQPSLLPSTPCSWVATSGGERVEVEVVFERGERASLEILAGSFSVLL
jgi:hypothetical protein